MRRQSVSNKGRAGLSRGRDHRGVAGKRLSLPGMASVEFDYTCQSSPVPTGFAESISQGLQENLFKVEQD